MGARITGVKCKSLSFGTQKQQNFILSTILQKLALYYYIFTKSVFAFIFVDVFMGLLTFVIIKEYYALGKKNYPIGGFMANYNVTIINGSGSQTMEAGDYSVSAIYAPGYDMSSLSPTSYAASSTSETGAFTIGATGTLTIIFNETGAQGGTPITSGSVVMTDSTGATQYGPIIDIDSNGTATFNNVPFGSEQSAYTLYFKQLTSDENHNIYQNVFAVGMGDQTQTEYILNTLKSVPQNFTLIDANYPDLPVYNAVLRFENNEEE